MSLEAQGQKVPHQKALRYGKYDTNWLCNGSTPGICQNILKSGNLLHDGDFVDFQRVATVFSTGVDKQMLYYFSQTTVNLAGIKIST